MDYYYVSPEPIFEVKGFGKMALCAFKCDESGCYPIFKVKERSGRVEEIVCYMFSASTGAWYACPLPELSKRQHIAERWKTIWTVPKCPIPMGLLVSMIKILCIGDGKPKHLSSVLKYFNVEFDSPCHFISIFGGGWMMEFNTEEEGKKRKLSGAHIFTHVMEWFSKR